MPFYLKKKAPEKVLYRYMKFNFNGFRYGRHNSDVP